MRRLAPPWIAAFFVLALALGCGESDTDKFIGDYKPLNDRLLAVSGDLSKAVQGADAQSREELADTLAGLARELESVRDDIADLDTPDDLRDESEALTKQIGAAVGDIEDISEAAASNDAQAEAAATVALGSAGLQINRAQNKLAGATGADVGPG